MMRASILFLGLGALQVLSSCGPHHEEKEDEVKFLVTSSIKLDTAMTKQYVCQVQAIRHIELRAQERGYLQQILVDEGSFVREGQHLFQIMPRLYDADVQKAKAEADFAEIEYRNTMGLADSNVVSQNELAMSKAKLAKANAELALAQVHLDFTDIRAPFDGIIDRFPLKLGSLVDEGDLLTNLSDNSRMWVYFNVPEAEYLDYRINTNKDSMTQVDLLMANGRIFKNPGKVETIEADFNNETGNIAFRAVFENHEGLLRHGETGNILMVVPLKDAVLVPQKASFEVLDKKYVYVVDAESKVRTREITIGAELEDLYVVSAGLKEDEKILLEGIRKVREGDKIEFEYQEPREVMSHLKLYAE